MNRLFLPRSELSACSGFLVTSRGINWGLSYLCIFGNCSEPVLNSYASGDASHPESPDATSFTLSYALSSKCFGLF